MGFENRYQRKSVVQTTQDGSAAQHAWMVRDDVFFFALIRSSDLMHAYRETGTIELSAPVVLELDSQYQELASKFKKLVISTTDSTEKLSKKEAEIRGSRIEYDIDLLRLPCYSRFSSVLTFELEGSAATGLFGSDAKALSMLWLQELVDDETRQIKIPIMVSKNIEQLRQNVRSVCLLSILLEEEEGG